MAPPPSGKTKSQRDKEYRDRLRKDGRCIGCAELLDRAGSRCQSCVDKLKEKRNIQRANDLCTTCGKSKGDVEGSLCVGCKQDAINRRNILKEQSLCIDCAKSPASAESVRCEVCHEKNLSNYYEWKEKGLCTRCGANKEQKTKSHCDQCLNYIKNHRRKVIEDLTKAGLCICCFEPKEDSSCGQECISCKADKAALYAAKKLLKQCVSCDIALADCDTFNCLKCLEKANNRYYTRKAQGICVCCGAEALPSSNYCLICWFKAMAASALGDRKRWEDLEKIWEQQQGKCFYTDTILIPGQNASVDHKTPSARGGDNENLNIQWVIKYINTLKGSLTHEEFIQYLVSITSSLIKAVIKFNTSSHNISDVDLSIFLTKYGPKHPTTQNDYSSLVLLENKNLAQACIDCDNLRGITPCAACLSKFDNLYFIRKSQGLCVRCETITIPNSIYCLICWFKAAASNTLEDAKRWEDLQKIMDQQQKRCIYTDTVLVPGQNASIDHKVPTSRGGDNENPNIQWVVKYMNTLKGELTHEEFIPYLKLITSSLIQVVVKFNATNSVLSNIDLSVFLTGAGNITSLKDYSSASLSM